MAAVCQPPTWSICDIIARGVVLVPTLSLIQSSSSFSFFLLPPCPCLEVVPYNPARGLVGWSAVSCPRGSARSQPGCQIVFCCISSQNMHILSLEIHRISCFNLTVPSFKFCRVVRTVSRCQVTTPETFLRDIPAELGFYRRSLKPGVTSAASNQTGI